MHTTMKLLLKAAVVLLVLAVVVTAAMDKLGLVLVLIIALIGSVLAHDKLIASESHGVQK